MRTDWRRVRSFWVVGHQRRHGDVRLDDERVEHVQQVVANDGPDDLQRVAELRGGVGHDGGQTERDGTPADVDPILALLRLVTLTIGAHHRVVDGVPDPGECEDDGHMTGFQAEDVGVEIADVERDALEHEIHCEVDRAVAEDLFAGDLVIPVLRGCLDPAGWIFRILAHVRFTSSILSRGLFPIPLTPSGDFIIAKENRRRQSRKET